MLCCRSCTFPKTRVSLPWKAIIWILRITFSAKSAVLEILEELGKPSWLLTVSITVCFIEVYNKHEIVCPKNHFTSSGHSFHLAFNVVHTRVRGENEYIYTHTKTGKLSWRPQKSISMLHICVTRQVIIAVIFCMYVTSTTAAPPVESP